MAKRRRRDRPSVQARKALPPAEPSMETWLGWFHDEARAEVAEARRLAGWGCLLVGLARGGRR